MEIDIETFKKLIIMSIKITVSSKYVEMKAESFYLSKQLSSKRLENIKILRSHPYR